MDKDIDFVDDLMEAIERRALSDLHTKMIIDSMPGGFFIYRAVGAEELLYCNHALLRLFGCETMEEFKDHTGYTFPGIVHPDDIDEVEKSIAEQISASHYDLDYVEYRIIQKDGTVRWVEDYGHFVDSKDGGIFYVFVADATEKRQQQMEARAAELESANEELRRRLKLIEGFSVDYDSIFYAELDKNEIHTYQMHGRISAANFLGKARPYDKMQRDYISQWVVPEDREMVENAVSPEYIRRHLSEAKTFQLIYRVAEGDHITHLQLRISDVGNGDHVSQIVLGYRRVDQEILMEVEQREFLEDALNRSRTAMEAKNIFLSNMSHDIRTPLNTVVGYTALARKNMNDPEKLKDCLDQIESFSNRTLRLINDVLDLTQLESDNVRTEEIPCELIEILHGVQAYVNPMAAAKGIRLSLDLMGLHHSAVYCDRDKLLHVLSHLASNAVKYTPMGGTVQLSVTEHGASTRDYAAYSFAVKDSGVGIAPEFLSRVFEPFERQKNSTQSGVLGMGLGLTLAKSKVELMGGTLTVESEPDKGSCFTVSLSLRVQEHDKHVQHRHTAAAATPRILLVEDNDINRELCAEILMDAGFLVETAANGRIAVDMVTDAPPDHFTLVLMDIQMPVMDGNEAARSIRSLPDATRANIPIVALSANSMPDDRKRSMESGMNAHLAKPIQINEVIGLLKEFTGSTED